MKKGKLFAPFLMLLSGLIASVMMYVNHYDKEQMLLYLVLVMVFFYLIGFFVQHQIIKFMKKIKEEEAKEGEVIEKEAPTEEEDGTVQPQKEVSEENGAKGSLKESSKGEAAE